MDKMLGKVSRYSICTCCSDDKKKPARRSQRRRERQKFLRTYS